MCYFYINFKIINSLRCLLTCKNAQRINFSKQLTLFTYVAIYLPARLAAKLD